MPIPMVPVIQVGTLCLPARAARLARLEALAAVDRLARAWVERYFGFLAAFAAGRRVQGALAAAIATVAAATAAAVVTTTVAIATVAAATTVAIATAVAVTTSIALALSLLTAGRAALGIRKSSRRVKILLTRRERKLVAAIATGQRSIAHFLLNLSRRIPSGSGRTGKYSSRFAS